MARSTLCLVVAGGFLLLAACGNGDFDDSADSVTASPPGSVVTITPALTASPPATAGPSPTPSPHDAGDLPSGVALIDEIVRAVEDHDAVALAARIHYFLIPCTEPRATAAVPCPAGQPPGTIVQAFGSGCDDQSTFIPQGSPAAAIVVRDFLADERALWAVVETHPFPGDERIPGKFMVIFRNASGGGSAVSVDEEGITYFLFGCTAGTPPETFARGSNQYLIPPP